MVAAYTEIEGAPVLQTDAAATANAQAQAATDAAEIKPARKKAANADTKAKRGRPRGSRKSIYFSYTYVLIYTYV